MSYSEWIANNVTEPYGQCERYSTLMIEKFPELKKVRGHYHCPVWGEREHWWCVSPDGEVVDPTASQFPSNGRFEYVELDESLPQPTGICPNCGEYVYDGRYVHEECEAQFIAHVNGGQL